MEKDEASLSEAELPRDGERKTDGTHPLEIGPCQVDRALQVFFWDLSEGIAYKCHRGQRRCSSWEAREDWRDRPFDQKSPPRFSVPAMATELHRTP